MTPSGACTGILRRQKIVETAAFAIFPAEIECRQESDGRRRIAGRFPYSGVATIADRGSTRKERFHPRAFQFTIDDPAAEVSLLRGHEFDKPLASRNAGSLELRNTQAALEFIATLPPDDAMPSWVTDTVRAINAGLMPGLSPGFRIPPSTAVSNAVELVPEPGNPGVFIRQINAAVLYELSVVTRAAYRTAAVEMRSDNRGRRRCLLTL